MKNLVLQLQQISPTTIPVFNILENTIGNIQWQQDSDGIYSGVLAGAFPENKTWISGSGNWYDSGNPYFPLYGINGIVGYYSIYRSSDNIIQINVVDTSNNSVSLYSLIGETIIYLPEIRVYP